MPGSSEPVGLGKRTFQKFSEDEGMTRAAALSYYAVFSIPAVAVIVINIAGMVMGQKVVTGEIRDTLTRYVSPGVAQEVISMANGAAQSTSGGFWATLVGFVALIFGATGAFVQLQDSLNKAWNVGPRPEESGLKAMLKQRALAFAEVLGLAVLLLAYMVLSSSSAMNGATSWLPQAWAGAGFQAVAFGVNVAMLTLVFAILFKTVPQAEVRWGIVWAGAFATALLFTSGQLLLSLYFGHSNVANSYGAAGSLALLMLWIYYSSILVLLGAEFTQVWANAHGEQVHPSRGAIKVVWHREQHE